MSSEIFYPSGAEELLDYLKRTEALLLGRHVSPVPTLTRL